MALHNITDLEQDTPVSKVMNQNPFQPYTMDPQNIIKAINQTLQLQIPPTISTQTAFHHFTQ